MCSARVASASARSLGGELAKVLLARACDVDAVKARRVERAYVAAYLRRLLGHGEAKVGELLIEDAVGPDGEGDILLVLKCVGAVGGVP